jgi:AraC-like DNA-binding protein
MATRQPRPESVSVRTHVLDDVDAMAGAMADGLTGEYVQLEARPFRCRWMTARCRGIVAQFASEDVAVARRLRVPADRWAFMIPLDVPDGARWNGRPVRAGEFVVCPPGTECLAFDPPSTHFAILTAAGSSKPVAAIRRMLDGSANGPLAAACGPRAFDVRDRLIAVRDRFESGRVDVEGSLAACLARSVADRADPPAAAGSQSGIVRRAEAFFRTHVTEGVSVAQLSTVAGVSERSLRNAFYDVYTTSPKRYMKLWQLHQVRRALRVGDVRSATVTEIATCHGFYELGRFAGAYKSLFGEAPSETLNKARRQQATLRGAA